MERMQLEVTQPEASSGVFGPDAEGAARSDAGASWAGVEGRMSSGDDALGQKGTHEVDQSSCSGPKAFPGGGKGYTVRCLRGCECSVGTGLLQPQLLRLVVSCPYGADTEILVNKNFNKCISFFPEILRRGPEPRELGRSVPGLVTRWFPLSMSSFCHRRDVQVLLKCLVKLCWRCCQASFRSPYPSQCPATAVTSDPSDERPILHHCRHIQRHQTP